MNIVEVRFHGRGGQGAKLASRILGRSGFLSGLESQDFALFGAERRGAPVVSFTRISSEPIDRRGTIDRPDLIVVMDGSLLSEASSQVFHGVEESTPVFVNGAPERFQVSLKDAPRARFQFVDLTAIAREYTAGGFVSAGAAAVAAKCVPSIALAALEEAVRIEVAEFGLAPELAEKNVAAARAVYRIAPAVELAVRASAGERAAEPSWEAVPYLGKSGLVGPTIQHRGSAALRATGSWRMARPEIDLARCKRCFLCYLYCPEAAMRLDAENFPRVDYDHCKGCMICYEECPTDAISIRLEA